MFTKADVELAAIAAGQHSIFTLDDAARAGLSDKQIRHRSMLMWERVHEAVYRVPGAVPTWKSDLIAACFAAEAQPTAVSHYAAAALYDLPMGRNDVVEITTKRWNRTIKHGLVVHESTRFNQIDLTMVDGIPVVTPERMVLELAGQRPYVDFVERVIQAARRKRLITYSSTLATFDRLRRRGLPGVQVMREALELWDPNSRPTQSEMETRVLQILRDHGLPEPIVQFDVLDQYGNLVATTDLGMPKWKVTVEYDSDQEHSDEFQIAADNRRRNKIVAAGYKPITARKNDVWSGGHMLVDEIRSAAKQPA